MTLPPYFLWTTGKCLIGHTLNGELDALPTWLRPFADHLNRLPPGDRLVAWQAFLYSQPDREKIIVAQAAIDPTGPPPEMNQARRPANLNDLRQVMSDTPWVWQGWIAGSRIGGITAAEGVGKTRLAMDLARRIWNGLPWPDGQPATFPKGTPSLWLCSDGQQDDIFSIAESYGMPGDSVFFNTLHEDAYGGTSLDDPEALPMMEEFIGLVRPGLVFIDSLSYATSRDLCKADHVMPLMTPIRDIAQKTQTAIIPLLHVAMDGQALGKRIKGITRTILHLECPDPDQSQRLRLSVSKTYAKKPPALGVTMGDVGSEYDGEPPDVSEAKGRTKPGRPTKEREEAMSFIRESLAARNGQVGTSLRAKWHQAACEKASKAGKPEPKDTSKTFNRAKEDMINSGELTEEGGTGTGMQWTLHLVSGEPEPEPEF